MSFNFWRDVSLSCLFASKPAKPIALAVPVVFIILGTIFTISFLRDFFYEHSVAARAVQVPCEVVSASLQTHFNGRTGNPCYAPRVVYEYEFGAQKFQSDVIDFSPRFSLGEFSPARAKLSAFQNRKTCWVDPENPRKSALKKPSSRFYWSKFLPVLFPLGLALFGVFFLVMFLRAFRRGNEEI